MKASTLYINTTKEAPNEAELISHKLMLRAGLIRRLASGIYTWLPLGLKVLRKVENIVRDEMNKIGANEMLMPSIQPAELWQESGRWEFYGSELLRIKDRHQRDFCYGPTHEEVVVDIIRKDVKSYKQLPLSVYQIQTKFRDEVRPRFGVMRAREFIMKDAYSFHTNYDSLVTTYNDMYQAYSNIFNRLGLKFRAVAADTGAIGGTGSHEFQVLAGSGEDIIAYSDGSDYSANIELATYKPKKLAHDDAKKEIQKIATPTQKTCENIATMLNAPLSTTVKSLVFEGADGNPVLILIRGDHELNEIKASKISQLKQPITFASHGSIEEHFNCQPEFIGPVGFNGFVIVDYDVACMSDFICGANENGYHLAGVNFERDCAKPNLVIDIRNVVEGDTTPDGMGTIKLCRGIEVGHVFQLRTKYSEMMGLNYLDQNGKSQLMEMGCYGIGVSRIIGAAIEQNNDERGIIFPLTMAPFAIVIVPVNYHKSDIVKTKSDDLYQILSENEAFTKNGFEVLLDDRDERLGSMLADSELIGIPLRIVVGEKTLANNQVELYNRITKKPAMIDVDGIINTVDDLLNGFQP
jgi:prolyl-tRNA synthetase